MVQARYIHDQTPKPSQEWLILTDVQRLALVRSVESLNAWITKRRWVTPTFYFIKVEGIEITVKSIMQDDSGRRGERLRSIELMLRNVIQEPLELYCERQDDQNKPRDPVHRQRIMEWLQARKLIKLEAGVAY